MFFNRTEPEPEPPFPPPAACVAALLVNDGFHVRQTLKQILHVRLLPAATQQLLFVDRVFSEQGV